MSKNMGKYKYSIKKVLNEEGKILVELKISASLQRLLREYAVTDEELVPESYGSYSYERYKIKNILRNSSYWDTIYDLFFSTQIINDGRTKIELENNGHMKRLIDYQDRIVDMIKNAQQIQQNVNISVSIETRRSEE